MCKPTLEDIAEETDKQLEEGETLSIKETFEGLEEDETETL